MQCRSGVGLTKDLVEAKPRGPAIAARFSDRAELLKERLDSHKIQKQEWQ